MLAMPHQGLAERLAGLERTVERLMNDYNQLQRRLEQSAATNHGKSERGLSIWKRLFLYRTYQTSKPAVRENKRVFPHVVH